MTKRKEIVSKAKRVVVKVGSKIVASGDFDSIAGIVEEFRKAGKEVVLVSSGSIAMGMKKMELMRRPLTIPERQAISALGQTSLMNEYEAAFDKVGVKVAQVLLTQDDLSDRRKFMNAKNTLNTLLGYGKVVPIINENDTVAVEEIKIGDNDNLAPLVANLIEAELQCLFTDTNGYYDKNPKVHKDALRVSVIDDIDSIEIDDVSAGTNDFGTGGMASKITSSRTAAHLGTATIIADGTAGASSVVSGILEGSEDVGTIVYPKEDRLTSKKHWIMYSTRPSGSVTLDDGAKKALLAKGKSLLPAGITEVGGSFEAGDAIRCVGPDGLEFARGMVNYSSEEVRKIMGLKSSKIAEVLGGKVYDEVIHRDNLVLL